MDLKVWISGEHDAILDRFDQSVVTKVPVELWKEPAGDGGSSIAWLAFHSSYHEDIAVNAVLRGTDTVLSGARSELGLAAIPAAVGLGETEQPELTAALDIDGLQRYVNGVHDATRTWLAQQSEHAFDDVLARPDAGGPEALERAGVAEADVAWLYRMWDAKPATFFLQWEAIGHRINHVGEMVSVRNRLGLSPF